MVHEFASDPEVSKHSTWGPNSLEQSKEWLEDTLKSTQERPRLHYEIAITKNDSGSVIGTAMLTIKNQENGEGEIGYTIRSDQWGNGYATEVAYALLKFGFETLKLRRIYATTSPLNIASQRILNKSGMRQEGYFKKHVLQRGVWRDSLFYAVLDEEWFKNTGY